MTILRILLATGGLVLLASIIWASQTASIGASFSAHGRRSMGRCRAH